MSLQDSVFLKKKLKENFGYQEFREGQEAVIRNVIAGNDTLVIMPTGGGKSLCYQLPAILQKGTSIIVSPLIALMKDQVDYLERLGIKAAYLNSTLPRKKVQQIREEILKGELKLLYIAPESLSKENNLTLLKKINIPLIAIDEAHCISGWGHDFRPEYRKIRQAIVSLNSPPVIALTATATLRVQNDILRNLSIEGATLFKTSFDRKNLYYEVRPKHDADKQLVQFIRDNPGSTGVVYCHSRKKVTELADLLTLNGISAVPYHAGLDTSARIKAQEAFLNEKVDVIVATIAFGMGIDKGNVRFVVHYTAPRSLEGYYQETGRAGRDGLPAKCVMYYDPHDMSKLKKLNKDKPVAMKANALELLHEVTDYAYSPICRRKQLLHYFGERYPKNCGKCDNCSMLSETPTYEGKEYVVMLLEAVKSSKEALDRHHIVELLQGSENPYMKTYQLEKLPVYGKGGDRNATFWYSLVHELMILGWLSKKGDQKNILQLTTEGKKYLDSPYSFKIRDPHSFDQEEKPKPKSEEQEYDKMLFHSLSKVRETVAHAHGILDGKMIFQDQTLIEMSISYPRDQEALSRIIGVGAGKASKFGSHFLEEILRHMEDQNINLTQQQVITRPASPIKYADKVHIIRQIDRKMDFEEMAALRSIDQDELIQRIEQICMTGVRLNIDYFINKMLTEEKQKDLFDYFRSTENHSIEEACDELEDEFTESEIRLMRIKFLSEFVN